MAGKRGFESSAKNRIPAAPAPTDERLLRLAAEGDRAAFDSFSERHLPALFRFASLTCRSRSLAETAIEEGLASAWQRIRAGAREPCARTWLFRTVVEACHRRTSPARAAEVEESTTAPARPSAASEPRMTCPECEEVQRWLSEYLDETLGESERARLEAHLNACMECGRDEAQLRATVESLHGLNAREPLPEDSRERLLHARSRRG